MSAVLEIAKLSTTAVAKKHDDKSLLVNKDGVLPAGGLLYNAFNHAASATFGSNAKHALCHVHLLDGGAARTITLPADLSPFIGRRYLFVATGTARAHVITGTAGQLNGNQSVTFPTGSTGAAVEILVTAADNANIISIGHSTVANDYVIA